MTPLGVCSRVSHSYQHTGHNGVLLTPRYSGVIHRVKEIPVVPFDINGGVFVEALKAGDKVADRPSASYFAYVACLTPRSDKDGGGGVHLLTACGQSPYRAVFDGY